MRNLTLVVYVYVMVILLIIFVLLLSGCTSLEFYLTENTIDIGVPNEFDEVVTIECVYQGAPIKMDIELSNLIINEAAYEKLMRENPNNAISAEQQVIFFDATLTLRDNPKNKNIVVHDLGFRYRQPDKRYYHAGTYIAYDEMLYGVLRLNEPLRGTVGLVLPKGPIRGYAVYEDFIWFNLQQSLKTP